MQEEEMNAMDLLVKAFEESKGETVDLIVEHDEIRDVTPEMFYWWGQNIRDSTRYRMWCPEDHVSFELETPPTGDLRLGVILRITERISEFPASVMYQQ
jgi:hypothetical protein